MRKEEERKTKQKRRVVNAAPEQENEITQKKSAWCSGAGREGRAAYRGTGRAAGSPGRPPGQRGVRIAALRRRHRGHATGSASPAGSAHHADSTCHPFCCQLAVSTPLLCPPLCPLAVSCLGQPLYSLERRAGTIHSRAPRVRHSANRGAEAWQLKVTGYPPTPPALTYIHAVLISLGQEERALQ